MRLNKSNILIAIALLSIILLYTPLKTLAKDCIETKFTPLSDLGYKLPFEQNTSIQTDNSFRTYSNLKISESIQPILSICSFGGKNINILRVNPNTGKLQLVEAGADSDLSATRGICTFSNDGNNLFFLGSDSNDNTSEKIFPLRINYDNPLSIRRFKSENTINEFIPPDSAKSLTVTPNNKFLVYTQDNTPTNITSIQSVKINNDGRLDKSFIGQAISRVIRSASFLELIQDTTSSNYTYGIFSDFNPNIIPSGKSFGIFRTNQKTGVNNIIAEYTNGINMPGELNNNTFNGFSGLKFFEKDGVKYLIASYIVDNPNIDGSTVDKLSKLALFKINIKSDKHKSASIEQIGLPENTLVKVGDCLNSDYNLISGSLEITDKNLYIADGVNNYLASYNIDWDAAESKKSQRVFKLSSIPIKTTNINSDKNSAIAVSGSEQFAYVITSGSNNINDVRIFEYSLKQRKVDCSALSAKLTANDICAIKPKPISLTSRIPDQVVAIGESLTLNLNNYIRSANGIKYTIIEDEGISFLSLDGNLIDMSPTEGEEVGRYKDVLVLAQDDLGNRINTTFNINVVSESFREEVTEDTGTSDNEEIAQGNIFPTVISGGVINNLNNGSTIGNTSTSTQNTSVLSSLNISMNLNSQSLRNNKKLISKIPPRPYTNRLKRRPSLPDLPQIELIPTSSSEKVLRQSLKLSTSDLKGGYQVVIAPKIPKIISLKDPLERAQIESYYKGDLPLPNEPGKALVTLEKVMIGEDISLSSLPERTKEKNSIKIKTTEEPLCCSCKGKKLTCKNNNIPVCEGGIVKCIEGSIQCCKGKDCTKKTEISCLDAAELDLNSNKSISIKNLIKNLKKKKIFDTSAIQKAGTTRGAIVGGTGGYIIFLKGNVNIEKIDLKNIVYALVDSNNKTFVISGSTSKLAKNKILSKLTVPETIKAGKYRLVVVENKGAGKKAILSKSKLKVYKDLSYSNVNKLKKKFFDINKPSVQSVRGRIIGNSKKGGKLIRLTFTGNDFASRVIETEETLYGTKALSTNTKINFPQERGLEILRTRILPKGSKILLTIRYEGENLDNSPFTISTPNGQVFKERLGLKLFKKKAVRKASLK